MRTGTASAIEAEQLDRSIRCEQVRLLYDGLGIVLVGSVGISLATVFVLWDRFPPRHLLGWLTLSLAVAALRALLGMRFRRRTFTEAAAPAWARWFVLGAFANGLVWSLVPVLYFPSNEPLYVLFICCLYAGYVSGSVASTSVFLPAFVAFTVPISVALAGRMLASAESISVVIGVMIIFYACASLAFARKNQQTIAGAIRLQLENAALLGQLREQRDAAERAVHAKNRFLAATSHDLRQPLHALGLFVDSLETRIRDEDARRTFEKIRESTAALNDLFHGILDLSSLDANTVECTPKHVRLDALLKGLRDEFEVQAERKGLAFSVEVLPGHVAHVDGILLERILRNLIDNAIHYTESGSVRVHVEAGGDDRLRLSVADTGYGIPAAEQDNVFSEYHQLRNPERDRRKGLGLGLAIVRRLCRLMQVPLELESQVGCGSTFRLTLPRGDPDKVARDSGRAPRAAFAGLKVVVIDDEADILEGTRALLGRWGCDVVCAPDHASAIAQMHGRAFQPAIVIADYRLRGNVTGLEAIEAIRQEFNADIAGLLITGETLAAELAAADRAGIPVLHKPVKPGELRTGLNVLARGPAPAGQSGD